MGTGRNPVHAQRLSGVLPHPAAGRNRDMREEGR